MRNLSNFFGVTRFGCLFVSVVDGILSLVGCGCVLAMADQGQEVFV